MDSYQGPDFEAQGTYRGFVMFSIPSDVPPFEAQNGGGYFFHDFSVDGLKSQIDAFLANPPDNYAYSPYQLSKRQAGNYSGYSFLIFVKNVNAWLPSNLEGFSHSCVVSLSGVSYNATWNTVTKEWELGTPVKAVVTRSGRRF